MRLKLEELAEVLFVNKHKPQNNKQLTQTTKQQTTSNSPQDSA